MRIIGGKFRSRKVHSSTETSNYVAKPKTELSNLNSKTSQEDQAYKSGKPVRNESGVPLGRPIRSGNVSGYRPTTDRARETLFNVLNNIIDFDQARCLDLFAGSGAIGFELLSRGADSCDFVENSHKQISNIQKTADELGCNRQVNIINENVIGFLKRSGSGLGFYDIIFADPPYGYEFYNELMQFALGMNFGIFVLEHADERAGMFNVTELKNEPGKPVRNDFDIIEKNVGMTNFTILIKKD